MWEDEEEEEEEKEKKRKRKKKKKKKKKKEKKKKEKKKLRSVCDTRVQIDLLKAHYQITRTYKGSAKKKWELGC